MKSKRAREATEAENPAAPDTTGAPAKKRKTGDDNDKSSTDVKKSKKNKDKYSKETRKALKEKRKNLQNLPEQDDDEQEADVAIEDAATTTATATEAEPKAKEDATSSEKKPKKEKKLKKREQRRKDKAAQNEANGEVAEKSAEPDGDDAEKSAEPNSGNAKKSAEPNGDNAETEAAAAATDDHTKKKDRHIVFVGNLPYSATSASITEHFASLNPAAVRCLKNKNDSNPCKGIAFVEFGKVWDMRTCLDKFHHSMFDDGVSPARKINVELTAGGGGKAQNRKDKIREKNVKLEENRTKRIEREKTAKAGGKQQREDPQHLDDAIHPSRRGRVPGNAY